ncbi:unnamed protein product [Caenorhabditis auriculariae]|uniref:Uncharacterized protein n=1 Tax=Caenorhabditis auriculariae TaxID=2777116 RepID=A0A8S1GS46_9PELO|nr:unnamed protein product [Caenorhabditis auriculariae]
MTEGNISRSKQNVSSIGGDQDLNILLMGDPQYHFMCEPDNVQCDYAEKSFSTISRENPVPAWTILSQQSCQIPK